MSKIIKPDELGKATVGSKIDAIAAAVAQLDLAAGTEIRNLRNHIQLLANIVGVIAEMSGLDVDAIAKAEAEKINKGSKSAKTEEKTEEKPNEN